MNKSIYSEEYKYIVDQLRKARKKANLNQAEVAKLIGKTQSYVSKIELGQLKIDILELRELAKIYNKHIEDFLK